MKVEIDERELATILAALRLWQNPSEKATGQHDECVEIATDGGRFSALEDNEVDDLCERLNLAENWANSDALWRQNDIQFPRLIAEIRANVDMNHQDSDELQASMDLTYDEIEELFDRADTAWEAAKAKYCPPGREG